jgi:hypothetical protein
MSTDQQPVFVNVVAAFEPGTPCYGNEPSLAASLYTAWSELDWDGARPKEAQRWLDNYLVCFIDPKEGE